MRKLVCAKLKSALSRTGMSPKEGSDDSRSYRLNLNEEYNDAFRTNSYEETWSKIQKQVERLLSTSSSSSSLSPSSSSSLSIRPLKFHLSDYLFEPQREEALTESMTGLAVNFHPMLLAYFEACLEACNVCELLLRGIHQTHSNYTRIRKVIKLNQRVEESADSRDQSMETKILNKMFSDLVAYSLLKDPLSYFSQQQFHNIHDSNVVLLHRLTSKQKKIRRRAKFNRICTSFGGYSLVICNTTLTIAMLAIACHSLIGIVVSPALMGFSLCLLGRNIKFVKGRTRTSVLDRLYAQLDIASKGTFIMINDFDTIRGLVGSLHEEAEHNKALADLCVRNNDSVEILQEVVRVFNMQDSGYLQQLDELERHVLLCFHTINRSRRLILQEATASQQH